MTTPEQPLTRKQLREQSKTGPVQLSDAEGAPEEHPVRAASTVAAGATARLDGARFDAARRVAEAPAAPRERVIRPAGIPERVNRPAAPAARPEAFAPASTREDQPTPTVAVDRVAPSAAVPSAAPSARRESASAGISPLTRKQLREQTKVRTAAVPIIADAPAATQTPADAAAAPAAPAARPAPVTRPPLFSAPPAPTVAEQPAARPAAAAAPAPAPAPAVEPEAKPVAAQPVPHAAATDSAVSPEFGAAVLAAEARVAAAPLPPSFDEIVARGSGVSAGSPTALILSQTPDLPPLSGPLSGSGDVLVTGTLHLPEGLGSIGADPRSSDGKEADLALFDRELPQASSPTPISASAAISTVRDSDEIIQPPGPEKGGRLVMTLAITAGVLAVAVIGVIGAAFATGVFG